MGKRRTKICQVWIRKVSEKLTNGSVEIWNDGVESGVYTMLHDEPSGYLPTAQVAPGVQLARA